jgi:hypothetical protein
MVPQGTVLFWMLDFCWLKNVSGSSLKSSYWGKKGLTLNHLESIKSIKGYNLNTVPSLVVSPWQVHFIDTGLNVPGVFVVQAPDIEAF